MRLLAITPPLELAAAIDPGCVDDWIELGAGELGLAVLLREPGADAATILAQARLGPLRRALAERRIPALLSVDWRRETAKLVASSIDAEGLAGVQLRGDPDGPTCMRWREALGPGALIGRSAHGLQPSDVPGLDYTCLAPIFAPRTIAPGDEKQAIGLDGLRRWAALRDDIVALGGITASNARACLDAGAHGFAGIRAFFGPRAEARQDVQALCRLLAAASSDHGQA